MNILVITKTNWDESPRIRHQITNLLRENNHKIIFIEKAHYKYNRETKVVEHADDLIRISHSELFHHQLRVFDFMQLWNSKYVYSKLKRVAKEYEVDLIINFNYDYSRVICNLDLPTISIFNDDFSAQGLFWMREKIKHEVGKTASVSNYNLAVSYPILNTINKYTNNSELFLPWAPANYKFPIATVRRDVILYYGYVSRINWNIFDLFLKNGFKLRVVGPQSKDSHLKLKQLKSLYSNLEIIGSKNFEDLYLDDVFCSIAPYDLNIKNSHAITANNRMFRLLSCGIPLIFTNISSLILAPPSVLIKCTTHDDFIRMANYYKSEFYQIQPTIKEFLNGNYSKDRLKQLNNIIEKIT